MFSACEQAFNCEVVDGPNGKAIRYKDGMDPSSEMITNLVANATGGTGIISARDSSVKVVVDISQHVTRYGTTHPKDVMVKLWAACQEHSCDPYPLNVATKTPGCDNEYGCNRQVTITASGSYGGWDRRQAFVDAITLAATAPKGLIEENIKWVFGRGQDRGDGVLHIYTQSRWFKAIAIVNGAAIGDMEVLVQQSDDRADSCQRVGDIFSTLAGELHPIIGGITGIVVGGICSQ